jgi:hypothetical protein
LLFPNPTARETLKLFTAQAEVVPSSEVQLFNQIRVRSDPSSSLVGNWPGLAPAAFTGRPIYVDRQSIFFVAGSVPPVEVNKRLAEVRNFLAEWSPAARTAWLRENRALHDPVVLHVTRQPVNTLKGRDANLLVSPFELLACSRHTRAFSASPERSSK